MQVKRKTLIIAFGIAAVLSVSVIFTASGMKLYKTNALKKDSVVVTRGNISDIVSETGTITSNDDYNITSKVSGKITSCNFEEDDFVEKGAVLYTIDSVDLRNQIEQQEMALKKAELSYRQSVNAANDLSIKATGDGIIQKLYIEKGVFVNAGTKIADIVDNDILKLKLPFNAGQIKDINVGSPAEIYLTPNNMKVYGRVSRIYDGIESLGSNRAAVYIELLVDNPGGIHVGDRATAIVNHIASMAEGQFEYNTSKTVVALQSGEVITKNVSEGTRVHTGQIIATLKNDTITNAIDNSKIQIEDIKTRLNQLNKSLEDYVITSPVSGVVQKRYVKLSEFATPQTPLAVISDRNSLCAEVQIDEIYISKIKTGQKVNMKLDALGDKTYTGSVKSIESTGVPKDGVTYYTVKIKIDDFSEMKVGMNVNVDIIVEEKSDVLLVPTKYINGTEVIRIKNGKTEKIKVKTGIRNKDYTEIIEGLNPDDRIIDEVSIK